MMEENMKIDGGFHFLAEEAPNYLQTAKANMCRKAGT